MKGTLQLIQLLLVVFGFYGAVTYGEPYKYGVPLFCLVVVWIVDRFEFLVPKKDVLVSGKGAKAKNGEEVESRAPRQLDFVLKGKNAMLLVENIHWLLRDMGMNIAACPGDRGADRLLTLEGGDAQFAVKVFADVDALVCQWEQWERGSHFVVKEESGQRLLFIVGNAAEDSEDGTPRFKDFTQQTSRLLADKRVAAMTTQTLVDLYKVCKEMSQNPDKIFRGIHQGSGGIFHL